MEGEKNNGEKRNTRLVTISTEWRQSQVREIYRVFTRRRIGNFPTQNGTILSV